MIKLKVAFDIHQPYYCMNSSTFYIWQMSGAKIKLTECQTDIHSTLSCECWSNTKPCILSRPAINEQHWMSNIILLLTRWNSDIWMISKIILIILTRSASIGSTSNDLCPLLLHVILEGNSSTIFYIMGCPFILYFYEVHLRSITCHFFSHNFIGFLAFSDTLPSDYPKSDTRKTSYVLHNSSNMMELYLWWILEYLHPQCKQSFTWEKWRHWPLQQPFLAISVSSFLVLSTMREFYLSEHL